MPSSQIAATASPMVLCTGWAHLYRSVLDPMRYISRCEDFQFGATKLSLGMSEKRRPKGLVSAYHMCGFVGQAEYYPIPFCLGPTDSRRVIRLGVAIEITSEPERIGIEDQFSNRLNRCCLRQSSTAGGTYGRSSSARPNWTTDAVNKWQQHNRPFHEESPFRPRA